MIKTIDLDRVYEITVKGSTRAPFDSFKAKIKMMSHKDYRLLTNNRSIWLTSGEDTAFESMCELVAKYTVAIEGVEDVKEFIPKMPYDPLTMLSVEITNLSGIGETEEKN